MANETELLFNELLIALQQFAEGRPSSASTNGSMKVPDLENHVLELERMLQKEKAEFEVMYLFFFLPLFIYSLDGSYV